ncbi:hypothetical protein EDD16DRAFT_823428 [Pisolithus croceorrhizus]|nr:hypothetical protein EDD16DRAFT_823428 [Pisolithus croceorrhizus]
MVLAAALMSDGPSLILEGNFSVACQPWRSMIFAAHPLSTTDPSSKWVSPSSQAGTMQAYARLPGSSSSSPGRSYSYAEPDTCSESNFDLWSSLWCSPQQPPKSQVVATVNPKATHWTTSDVATPSSASSYSIPTPLSAMGHFDVAEPVAQEEQDFDEFDYDDDDEDDECAESEDTMMNSEEDPDELSPASQPVPRTIKPTALDDQSEPTASFAYHYPLHYHSDTHSFGRVISDRKMTASAPGYPSTSHHSTTVDLEGQTWFQREQLSHSNQVFPETPHLQSPQHIYGGLGISSLPIGIPSAVALRHQHPSYYSSAISCTNSSQPIPIMQPQPIRPIPPIPLDEFASSAIENSPSDSCGGVLSSRRPQTYQLQNSTSRLSSDDPECYDDDDGGGGDASEEACQSLCSPQEHPIPQSVVACSAEELMYPRDCRSMAIRWHN